MIEGCVPEERSLAGKKQLSIVVFFFALFLIFDFYCGFKTFFFFFSQNFVVYISKSQLGNESSILSSTENAVSKIQLDDILEYAYTFVLFAQ